MPSTVAGAGAPASATVRRPCARTARPPRSTSMAAAPSSSLATRRLARRSAARSAAPERGTPDRRVAGAAEVLHERERPDADDLQRAPRRRRPTPPPRPPARPSRAAGLGLWLGACAERGPRREQGRPPALGPAPTVARDEADLRPGRQQSGRGAGGVPQRGVGAADQLPAAGRAAGVDAAELAREPDRPGRHARARLRPALDVQPGIAAGQVGEAGREAAEPDPPRRAGVRGHHLVGVEPGELGDLGQVRAVVDDGDLDGLAVGRVDRRRRPTPGRPGAARRGRCPGGR